MSRSQLVLGHLGTLFVIGTLVGLFVRHRYRLWYSFTLYLLMIATYSVLLSFWPQRFHRASVWQLNEVALNAARLAMVVELAWREFSRFPAALATARRVFLFIAAITFAAIARVLTGPRDYTTFVGEVMPRFLNGTIWLFTSLTVLTLWYRLPVNRFRKGVLLSYVPFLLVFTVTLNALGSLGWQRAAWADMSSRVAYFLLLSYWMYAAWRNDPIRPAPPSRDMGGPA